MTLLRVLLERSKLVECSALRDVARSMLSGLKKPHVTKTFQDKEKDKEKEKEKDKDKEKEKKDKKKKKDKAWASPSCNQSAVEGLVLYAFPPLMFQRQWLRTKRKTKRKKKKRKKRKRKRRTRHSKAAIRPSMPVCGPDRALSFGASNDQKMV